MSKFEVLVKKIEVFAHPDPETTSLEVGKIDDYQVIVKKGQFKTGDSVIYIPEAAILPDTLLQEMNLVGKLAGSQKNRVKAVKLRGILSQGLCHVVDPMPEIGTDMAEKLGIEKYEPVVPECLAGEVGSSNVRIIFDLENIKKYPNLFAENEPVAITEKIHGTWCGVCLPVKDQRKDEMLEQKFIVISKGLEKQNFFFKDNERNQNNTYLSMVKRKSLHHKLEMIVKNKGWENQNVWLLGEVFGGSIQDLTYGLKETEFKAFALKVGESYVNFEEFQKIMKEYQIDTVPVLYVGPFNHDVVKLYTNGESVESKTKQIKEGCVIVPLTEGFYENGRKALKSISEAYLLRKNGTEHT